MGAIGGGSDGQSVQRALPRWAAAAVSIVVSLHVDDVHAGGFEVPDLGTGPIGRGGAFVAKADSGAAFHYNPAGIAKQPGPHLLVSGNAIVLRSEFSRGGGGDPVQLPWNPSGTTVLDPADDPNTDQPYATVRNGARVGPSPMIVASWGDVGVPGLAFSAGLTPPVGFGSHDWPDDGPQRYTITDGRFLFLSGGVGVSYRFGPYLSLGANFLAGGMRARFSVATRQGSTGAADNEDLPSDNRVTMRVRDPFVPSASFGALSSPWPWLELGASVRLPFVTEATGTFDYAPGQATPDAAPASQPHVRLSQMLPTVVRAGARYVHPYFDLEADFVFENYGRVDAIDLEFSNAAADLNPAEILPASPFDDPSLLYLDTLGNGTVYTPMIATRVPLHFRDTYSVRLGGDVHVLPQHLTLRAGGFWASSAYPADHRTFSVRFPFTQQIGLGGGLTWHAAAKFDLTAGYLHIFQPDVVVTGGVAQANAYREPDDPAILGNVVNNGRYRASLDIFGLQAAFHFTRKTKEVPR